MGPCFFDSVSWSFFSHFFSEDIESYFEYYGFGKDTYRILQFEALLPAVSFFVGVKTWGSWGDGDPVI